MQTMIVPMTKLSAEMERLVRHSLDASMIQPPNLDDLYDVMMGLPNKDLMNVCQTDNVHIRRELDVEITDIEIEHDNPWLIELLGVGKIKEPPMREPKKEG